MRLWAVHNYFKISYLQSGIRPLRTVFNLDTEATDASAECGTRSDRPHARQGRFSRHGSGVPLRPADPTASVPVLEELGRCRGSRAGCPAEGVSKDRSVPRGFRAVVLDIRDYVQHG